MRLGDLERSDRGIAVVLGATAAVLLVGLSATGIYQFFAHAPNPEWKNYVSGSTQVLSDVSTGVAAVHGALGDLAAILTFIGASWFCFRVVFSISWTAVSAIVLTILALITGPVIRFNATVHDGEVDAVTSGYAQVFSGDADRLITDQGELGLLAARVWTAGHVLCLPVLVALIWFVFSQSRRRAAAAPAPEPSWLDHLGS